ncbi:MAG: hypothetical protein QG594_1981 [Bacteroidota bacterium]|nr:hypothetical protein [Bacteroidota bacterium]
MKRTLIILIATFTISLTFGQNKSKTDKDDIKVVINTFMTCLVKKDSIQFYNLFNADPVVWVGVFKDKTQQDRISKDNTKKNYFVSNYKSFYRSISDLGTDEEKFYNIKIDNDESIATVSFDYSFWEKNKKINWGKESWHLVKIKDEWKITSVIFSMDFEKVNPEPKKKSK